jgi:hypothetical protein
MRVCGLRDPAASLAHAARRITAQLDITQGAGFPHPTCLPFPCLSNATWLLDSGSWLTQHRTELEGQTRRKARTQSFRSNGYLERDTS